MRSASVISKLSAAWPASRWRDVTVLLAVSGGADSVALARAMTELRGKGEGRLILAHFNHRLRGAESDTDQAFVEQLASELSLQIVVGAADSDLAAGGSGEGVEGAAREARYAFLAASAGKFGARYLATAHTADDQAETVLFNVLRGTGLAGLSGISRLRTLNEGTAIIRPMLDVTRAEILDYLQSLGQASRDDSTNRLQEYTRNRIRLQLLPLLERDYNPRVREALLRLARIFGDARDLIRQPAAELLERTIRSIPGGVELAVAPLAAAHPALARAALLLVWEDQAWPLQDMSMGKWDYLAAKVQQESAPSVHVLPGNIRVERTGDVLRLTRLPQQ